MSELFGIDAASFQGNVNWPAVDLSTAFGWEKVTQGTTYTNPFWDGPAGHAQDAMRGRAAASGFVPGGYLFLEAGDGAGQADHFAAQAGDMSGFAVAVDVEPTPVSRPTFATARACVARLRAHYPGKPITGYIPHWYWDQLGGGDLTFVDVLWASNYVTAPTGRPPDMYQHVVPAQWAGYGGMVPSLLQFTSRCSVAGVPGAVDCSAFRGGVDDLAHLLLGKPKPTPDPPAQTGDDMTPAQLPTGTAGIPVALANGASRITFFAVSPAQLRLDWIGVPAESVDVHALGYDQGRQGSAVPADCRACVVHRVVSGETTPDGTAGVGDGDEPVSLVVF